MRTGCHHFLDIIALYQFNILESQGLVKVFVTHFAHRLATTFFFFAEDTNFDAGSLTERYKALGDFDITLVKGSITADKIENIHIRIFRERLDAHLFGPVAP